MADEPTAIRHITSTKADVFLSTASCSCGWQRQFKSGMSDRHTRLAARAADKHAKTEDRCTKEEA